MPDTPFSLLLYCCRFASVIFDWFSLIFAIASPPRFWLPLLYAISFS